jgi:transcription elongation factor GreA
MFEEKQYLTQDGIDELEKRLRILVDVRRLEVAERLHNALEEGGELTENQEYHDAKNEQAFIEGEIVRITQILRYAVVINEDEIDTESVQIGNRVTVLDKSIKEEEVFHIVGSAEANPRLGKISVDSPVGRALIGAKVKDKVKVDTPNGVITLVIRSIS